MCKYRRDFISLWLVITGFAHSTYQKVVLLTGGSKGIGFRCAQALANHHKVVIASRTPPSSDCDFKFEHILLDISNCNEVARFVKAWGDRSLDVLVLNAGIQNTQLDRSVDGYELTIATNHIGGYHLCTALLPRVRKGGRVVFVGSGVHNPEEAGGNLGSRASLGSFAGLHQGFLDPVTMIDGGSFDSDKAYKDSKLCNVMTALELARRLKAAGSDITCNVMIPGLVPTSGLFKNFNPLFVAAFTVLTRYVFKVAVSEQVAGHRLAYMVTSTDLDGVSGKYFSAKAGDAKLVEVEPSKEAQDASKAAELWELTDSLITRALAL